MNIERVAADSKFDSHIVESYKSTDGNYSISIKMVDPPILKIKLEGFAELEDVRKTWEWFNAALQQLEEQGHHSLFVIANVEDFDGTSWRGKIEFQGISQKLFKQKQIQRLILIKPSVLVQNMIYLVKKMYPKLQISIHDNEKEGINEIDRIGKAKGKGKAKGLTGDDSYYEGLLHNSDSMFLDGKELAIFKKPNWSRQLTGNHRIEFYLLNGEVVLYREIGSLVNMDDISITAGTMEDVISHSGLEKMVIITDFSKLKFVSLKCRKALATELSRYKGYWKYKFYIFPRLIRAMYNVYAQFDPKVKLNSTMVRSWKIGAEKYINMYLNQDLVVEKAKVKTDSIDYSTFSTDELISIINQKEEVIRKITKSQNKRIDKLFKTISKISWDENFIPSKVKFETKKDPFTPLINAINLLENDIYEIVNDLKDFNVNLETKVKERTSELLNQNEELLKVNAELDSFVYKTSHDLRAPLVTIMGLVNLYRNEKDLSERDNYLELVAKSVDKLDGFIKDIIDFSRNARLNIEKSDIDFKEMVESVFEDLHIVQTSRIEKRVLVENGIAFRSDHRRLRMIFNNLLSNAIKYQSLQTTSPFIDVRIKTTASGVFIAVEDNGQGIHQKHIPMIFDMFFRASESSIGSGLGLYIVKEAVTKLEGTIKVESEVNKGSRFEISLPNG